MKKRIILFIVGFISLVGTVFSTSCQSHKSAKNDTLSNTWIEMLTDSIKKIASEYPGEIGVAAIINNRDTIIVNNRAVYPMMSVFKVHQALAICDDFDRKGLSLDTLITIKRKDLDSKTWSPMMKDYTDPVFKLSVKDLLRYTLTLSDNNASNLMFDRLVGASATDRYIATIIPRSSFKIAYTEAEMSADHDKAYSNCTSPLGAAILMNRIFTDTLISREKQQFIMNTLKECKTGNDRISEPLAGKPGIDIAHKTGSGYTNADGVLAAHNDVAFISMPNDEAYTLAVFVKDIKGDETKAAEAISRISAAVYSYMERN